STWPVSGCSRPAITRSNVDLPLPLGPSSAVRPPSGTSIETSSRATKSPNRLVTLLAEMAISGLLFDRLRDQDPWFGQRPVVFLPAVSRRALREKIHREQHGHREQREDDRGGVRPRQIDLVEFRLDEQRQRLCLAGDVPRDHAHRPELAKSAR